LSQISEATRISGQLRAEGTGPESLGEAISHSLAPITLGKVREVGFANASLNETRIRAGMSIAALRDTSLMEGSDALVIAAGPSLHRFPTADIIRGSRFSGTIIATESSMSWCLRNGMVPDLVVTLDPHESRIVRWFGDPSLSAEALQRDDYHARQDMDPRFRDDQLRSNAELLELVNEAGPRIRIAISSSASAAVAQRVEACGMEAYWWNPMYDDFDLPGSLTAKIHEMNGLPCVNAGGNVGSASWVFAHAVLGKTRVGLVGIDFGYYDDTPYSRTQYYHEIVELVGEDRLDEVFVRIHNPYVGRDFYTDPAYLWYRDSFLEMAETARCSTYNCSGGGILFGPGVEWCDLGAFLSASASG
jgi:hypothetical protein